MPINTAVAPEGAVVRRSGVGPVSAGTSGKLLDLFPQWAAEMCPLIRNSFLSHGLWETRPNRIPNTSPL